MKTKMKKKIVKCPDCKNIFKTKEKEKTQCMCGKRFMILENEIHV